MKISSTKPIHAFHRSVLSAAILTSLTAPSAHAANWTCGSDIWSNPFCWQDFRLPTANDDVTISPSNGTNITISDASDLFGYSQAKSLTIDGAGPGHSAGLTILGGHLNVSSDESIGLWNTGNVFQSGGVHAIQTSLYLGSAGNANYTLTGNGVLNASREVIGASGTGNFNQNGGDHQVDQLYLAYGLNGDGVSNGNYRLYSGSLRAIDEYVGFGRTADFTQSGGENSVSNLYIASPTVTPEPSSPRSDYNLLGGSLVVGHEYVGNDSKGYFNQSGGTHKVNKLSIGKSIVLYNPGVYNLNDGNLLANVEYIGDNSNGKMVQTGGSHQTQFDNNGYGSAIYLGYENQGKGLYELSGGTLNTYQTAVGYNGTGTFDQSGGSHRATFVTVGTNASGIGTYKLSAGELTVNLMSVGDSGNGTVQQTGGLHQAGGLLVGNKAGSRGSYELSGGVLQANDETIGKAGNGQFIQSGGENSIARTLYIGLNEGGQGSYSLVNGRLSAGQAVIGGAGYGRFDQSGGDNSISGLMMLGADAGGSGVYNLSGGTLTAGRIEAGAGLAQFNWTGGTLNYTGDLYVGISLLDLEPSKSSIFNGRLTIGNNAEFTPPTMRLNTSKLVVGDYSLVSQQNGSTVSIANSLALYGDYRISAGELHLKGTQVQGYGYLATSGNGTIKGYGNFSNVDFDNAGMLQITGNSNIAGPFRNSGKIDIALDTTLSVDSGLANNQGQIVLSGGSFDNRGHALINSASITGAGTINSGGLTNHGRIGFSGQASTIVGDVVNSAQGQIAIDSNAALTVMDDLINNGNIHTETGTYSVYLGSVSGSGTFSGNGNLYFEGGMRPGNSPGLLSASGRVILGETNTTWMELGGLARGTEYDTFDVLPGSLSLGGSLNVDWYNGFTASVGDSFDLFMADSISGVFASTLFPTLKGINWQVALIQDAYGSTDVYRLTAAPVPLPTAFWLMGAGLMGLVVGARRRV